MDKKQVMSDRGQNDNFFHNAFSRLFPQAAKGYDEAREAKKKALLNRAYTAPEGQGMQYTDPQGNVSRINPNPTPIPTNPVHDVMDNLFGWMGKGSQIKEANKEIMQNRAQGIGNQPTSQPATTIQNTVRSINAPKTAAKEPVIQTPSPTTMPTSTPNSSIGRNPEFAKKPLTPQVKKAIEDAAKEFGVPVSLMYDVAWSESGFRPDAKNETPEGVEAGVPVGLYQFTPGTWNNDLYNYAKSSKTSIQGFDPRTTPREDPMANARAAAYLIKQGQLGKWEASMPNWGRYYSSEELNPYFAQTPNWKGQNSYYQGK